MSPILCPECGHDIDAHLAGDVCLRCITRWEQGDDIALADVCHRLPSEIARALLTAEPTDAEVEAGGRALWGAFSSQGATPWRDLPDADRDEMRKEARAVLRGARVLS